MVTLTPQRLLIFKHPTYVYPPHETLINDSDIIKIKCIGIIHGFYYCNKF